MAKKNKNNNNIDYAELTTQEKEALLAAQTAQLRENDRKLAEDKQKEDKKETKFQKWRKRLTLLAVILFIMLLLAQCSSILHIQEEDVPLNIGFEDNTINQEDIDFDVPFEDYDPSASMLVMTLNYYPIFEDGLSEGDLWIINDEHNVYDIYVEIYLDNADGEPDMGSLVYRTKIIRIGQALPGGKLMLNLPAGQYQCTAFFYGTKEVLNEEGEYMGHSLVGIAACKPVITVLNTRAE